MKRSSTWILVATAIGTLSSCAYAEPSVVTDKADYSPEEMVQIYGSGFWADEVVQLQVLHIDGTPNTGQGHEPWAVTCNGLGEFYTTWIVPWDDSVGSSFELTAIGLSSGLNARTTFTDGDYKWVVVGDQVGTLVVGSCDVVSFPITIGGKDGVNEVRVTLSVSNLPPGVTSAFIPNDFKAKTATTNSTLYVTNGVSVPAGAYPFTVYYTKGIWGTNTLTIDKAGTVTTISSSANPAVYEAPVTFTATVTPQFGGTPTGTVTFKLGSDVLGTAALSGTPATASLAVSNLSAASSPYQVIAEYNGDANSSGSSSPVLWQTVEKAGTVVGPVTSSLNPAQPTDQITLTAIVWATNSPAVPVGTVQFRCNGNNLGTPVALVDGQASISVLGAELGHGALAITAQYINADGNFYESVAAMSPDQIVNAPPTSERTQ